MMKTKFSNVSILVDKKAKFKTYPEVIIVIKMDIYVTYLHTTHLNPDDVSVESIKKISTVPEIENNFPYRYFTNKFRVDPVKKYIIIGIEKHVVVKSVDRHGSSKIYVKVKNLKKTGLINISPHLKKACNREIEVLF